MAHEIFMFQCACGKWIKPLPTTKLMSSLGFWFFDIHQSLQGEALKLNYCDSHWTEATVKEWSNTLPWHWVDVLDCRHGHVLSRSDNRRINPNGLSKTAGPVIHAIFNNEVAALVTIPTKRNALLLRFCLLFFHPVPGDCLASATKSPSKTEPSLRELICKVQTQWPSSTR